MLNYPTIEVLLAIWQELPALAGDDWEVLESHLKTLLVTFDTATHSNMQASICVEIERVLMSVPAVIDRFDAEVELTTRSTHEQTVKGTLSEHIRGVLGLRSKINRPVICYPDISCPRRVWIKTPRILIVVRLKQHASIFSEVNEPLQVNTEIPLLVQIDAPGFKALGSTSQEITIISGVDSVPLVFDFAPQQVGYTAITFSFIQAGNLIGIPSLPVEITENEVSMLDHAYIGTPLRAMEGVKPPDFMLYISSVPLLNPSHIQFRLHPYGEVGREFAPVELKMSPENYASAIYRRFEKLSDQSDPTIYAFYRRTHLLLLHQIEEQLKEEGLNLWSSLIPSELKNIYEREREQWQDKSLLIISDEPYIPWELLWPYGDWKDAGPLCLQMNISRWLLRRSQGETYFGLEPALNMQEIAIIAPPDMELPAAQKERSLMNFLIKDHGLHDISPSEPTLTAVKQLLIQGGYTWMHIAEHGNFYPDDPDGESAICLKDNQPLTVRSIVGEMEKHLRDQRPVFVFNACEIGRQGWAITGLGGWASRLVGMGARLFLAPLWVIDDNVASTFSITFYQALLGGKTAAEAVRQGRIAARKAGDLTWLAYSLYAHPNARVV